MQAIITRYHGPTDFRGSRITATAGNGKRVTIPYPHELDSYQAHREAAVALIRRMGWAPVTITGGGLKDGGYAWVMLDRAELYAVQG